VAALAERFTREIGRDRPAGRGLCRDVERQRITSFHASATTSSLRSVARRSLIAAIGTTTAARAVRVLEPRERQRAAVERDRARTDARRPAAIDHLDPASRDLDLRAQAVERRRDGRVDGERAPSAPEPEEAFVDEAHAMPAPLE
jgi:hypothetical protein